MKKSILITALALSSTAASAQLSVAPEAGFQMTGARYKTSLGKMSMQMKAGFRAGLNLGIPLDKQLQLQGGLFYSAKGFKGDFAGYPIETTVSLNYLELPVYLNYISGVKGGNRFFAGIGPYAAYLLNGKVKSDEGDWDMNIGTDRSDDIRRMDYGFNLNAGYQWKKGLYIRLHYGRSLSENRPDPDKANRSNLRNTGIGISLGYNLTH